MLRAALATLLLGYAAALGLTALHVVGGTAMGLLAVWWPVVLIAAGVGGLWRGLGPAFYGRWIPLGTAVAGAVLLAAHLARVPLGALAAAAVLLWLGVEVAAGGRSGRPGRQA